MKKSSKKRKSFDTKLIEVVGNESLIYPNCASMIKKSVPFFPDMNTNDVNE